MIAADIGSRSYSFEISDNYISDFEITVAHGHVGKFDLPPDDFWGYEVENQDPNEIMHTLLRTAVTCSRLLRASSTRSRLTIWNQLTQATTQFSSRETL